MDLNSLFSSKAESTEINKVPFVPYLNSKSNEHLAIQFLEPLSESMKYPSITHWVKGVGQVKCALKMIPGTTEKGDKIIRMWNGIRRKDGAVLEPEHDCKFCRDRYAAQDELRAKEEKTGQKATKEEGTAANRLHEIKRELVFRVLWRLQERQGKRNVPKTEWAEGFLRLRINDLFSENGKGYFRQLMSASEEETLLEHVWLIKPGTTVLEKDAAIGRDEGDELTTNLEHSQWMSMIKDYKTGYAKYVQRQDSGNAGARENTASEQPEVMKTSVISAEVDDDDLPF